jgi:hypothetical protein
VSLPPVLDPRERFLREITERIPAERIAEIHLFPPVRSGGRESGVAVIAAGADHSGAGGSGVVPDEAGPSPDLEDTTGSAEIADPSASSGIEATAADAGPPPDLESTPPLDDLPDRFPSDDIDPPPPARLVVYRAVYRWTRKGPDRGRWEVDVTAEADAPLHAVSDVVRGVQRRAGEEGEPELVTPDALRVALSGRPWATAM